MPGPPPSALDGNQVLQHAFIDATGELRVSATLNPGGSSEVIISHTDDSIRLGDGTDLVTTTTNSGKIGLDVNIINQQITSNSAGNTTTVSLGASGSEGSFVIPTNTTFFEFRSEKDGKLDFGYASANRNFEVDPGNTKTINSINLSSSVTIYFSSSKNNDNIQIHYWI